MTAFIANTKGEYSKSGEDFWVKAETLLYTALIGLIYYETFNEEKNMNMLVELINDMEAEEDDENFKCPIILAFEEIELGVKDVDDDGNPALDEDGKSMYVKSPNPNHFAIRQYKKYRLAAGRPRSQSLFRAAQGLRRLTLKSYGNLWNMTN